MDAERKPPQINRIPGIIEGFRMDSWSVCQIAATEKEGPAVALVANLTNGHKIVFNMKTPERVQEIAETLMAIRSIAWPHSR